MIARCPYCSSIWVCWNWTYAKQADLERLNPLLHITSDEYGHECHDCGDEIGGPVFMTRRKITNGIPYKLLMLYGRIKYRIFRVDHKQRRKTHFQKLDVIFHQTKEEYNLMKSIFPD